MKPVTKIVIGLGYGDEGKGQTVHSLASEQKEGIVVRFNGGQQAGHTVVTSEQKHVFSSFGSGAFLRWRTYFSHHCTFNPVAALNELNILKRKLPTLGSSLITMPVLHPLTMITTPWDV